MRKSLVFSGVLLCMAVILLFSCKKQGINEALDPTTEEYKMAQGPQYEKGKYVFWAAQNIDVGTVYINQRFSAVTIEIVMREGWKIAESHIHAEFNWTDIPMNDAGNPMIGHFNYQTTHIPLADHYCLTLNEDFHGSFYIAIHADVYNRWQESAWAEGQPFPGNSWATYIYYVSNSLWITN